MSLTTGVFEIHSFLLKLVPLPYNALNNRLEVNPSYKNKYSRTFHMLCFTGSFIIILPICVFRLVWLMFHWNSFTSNIVDQLLMFSTLIGVSLIIAPVLSMFRTHGFEIVYMINQVCQLGPNGVTKQKHPNPTFIFPIVGRRSIQEIFIFSLAVPIVIWPPGIFVAPFTMPFMPIQYIFGQSIYVKLVSGILYGITGLNGAFSILSAILILIVVLENIIEYTSKINSNRSNLKTNLLFVVCVNRFRRAQLIVQLCNMIY